jgi:hypothetical protein
VVGTRSDRASAVIVVLILISIVFLYIGGTMRTLHWLGRDLRLIEKQQLQRLSPPTAPRRAGNPNAPATPATNDVETPAR